VAAVSHGAGVSGVTADVGRAMEEVTWSSGKSSARLDGFDAQFTQRVTTYEICGAR